MTTDGERIAAKDRPARRVMDTLNFFLADVRD